MILFLVVVWATIPCFQICDEFADLVVLGGKVRMIPAILVVLTNPSSQGTPTNLLTTQVSTHFLFEIDHYACDHWHSMSADGRAIPFFLKIRPARHAREILATPSGPIKQVRDLLVGRLTSGTSILLTSGTSAPGICIPDTGVVVQKTLLVATLQRCGATDR